jgi:hypothetical protein
MVRLGTALEPNSRKVRAEGYSSSSEKDSGGPRGSLEARFVALRVEPPAQYWRKPLRAPRPAPWRPSREELAREVPALRA